MRMAWAACCSTGDVKSAAQTLVDQSRGAGGNDERKMESSAKTNDSVLPERFACRANSKGIVPAVGCWLRGVRAQSIREA